MSDADWERFEALPKSRCECECGAAWRSHARIVVDGDSARVVARIACPSCGSDRPRAVRSDPETFTIRG